jgi:hypothetical protein
MENILRFQKEIHATNVEKGFWVPDRSKGEAVALICSELYEAVEAHRKHNVYKHKELSPYAKQILKNAEEIDLGEWQIIFLSAVKDTVEDEIADAVIRILDCVYGWNWEVVMSHTYDKTSTGNFAHDILRINWYVINAYHRVAGQNVGLHKGHMDWGYILKAILAFCEWYQIDLETHIEWKLRYNKSRPFKHGKQY